MSEFKLIGAAERKAVLDAIRQRGAFGQFSEDEVADLTARVEAAQTHAGLEAIRRDLPPEMPPLPAPPHQPSPWLMPSAPSGRTRNSAARTVAWVIGGAVLAIGLVVNAVNRDVDPDDPPETTVPPPSTTPTTEPEEVDLYNPNRVVLRVGTDIVAGRYRAT